MSKYRGLKPLAAALMLSSSLALVGCDNQSGDGAQRAAPKVEVVTIASQPVNITTELPGRTAAYRIAEVRPQVSGIILKRQFTEGSMIEENQSLYQIDPATYQATYDSAAADLAKAQAQANIDNLTVKRYKPLVGTNFISRQDYDTAVAKARQSDAAVLAAKAALDTARINLEYTKVMSPIKGRIGKSNVTEGALVNANQTTALATVQQLDPIYVDVTQSSNDYMALERELANGTLTKDKGAKAQVSLVFDDGTVYELPGKLEFEDVTVDETTGSITMRAVFPNPKNQILPGMFVRAKVEQGLRPDAILVPQQGVTRNQRGEATVLVVNKDNKVEQKVITTGQSVGSNWLVTGGLDRGEKVIVTGLQKIRVGVEVSASEFSDKPNTGEAPKGDAKPEAK
ncbi:MexE family multidrug efflux RND transporter periplasmic adaptor subunit [Leminorella grimontii]|uniref:MexE family multidrug efflux RND transporter periplasmic adaptor subunit n=1 Tax=Leminorella grimontii TaxID=82981 RepID=A0AAV5N4C3_9GAMM|nr:efflux RND transporter periplasmic adaptor subunit [Leminorella grimontii]KFC97186.1 RND efflux system membrane fusion protein [Leminorella grimontii ATCC 33999 = DSM 5078]GKX56970.1 MexE family multidrug efflux RND transporter periplasmic adaptor subunit [Leminorella grimontii]GKX58911.1 MexE family multidrug efflux RND transporter periplasmic adaptor subunit [Leminorella grimontii]VFS57411.1 Acriflavine resistance protein A precursor [Leminorella grimontii]